MKLNLSKATKPQPKAKEAPTGKTRLDKYRQELEDVKNSTTGDFYNVQDGKNTVRILPPVDESETAFLKTHYHFRIGPVDEAGRAATVACLKLMKKKRCPICEQADEFAKGTELEKKYSRALRPRARIMANAYIPGIGVKVLVFGKGVYEKLLGFFVDPEWGELDDIETGHNITIVRTGTGFKTNYEVRPAPKSRALEDVIAEGEDVDAVLEQRKDMNELVEFKTVQEVEELLEGTDFDSLLQRPAGGSSKKKGKKTEDEDEE